LGEGGLYDVTAEEKEDGEDVGRARPLGAELVGNCRPTLILAGEECEKRWHARSLYLVCVGKKRWRWAHKVEVMMAYVMLWWLDAVGLTGVCFVRRIFDWVDLEEPAVSQMLDYK